METTSTQTQSVPATVGMRVRVESPGWYRHGNVGTVVKVNRKTIKVQMDSNEVDVVVGSPIYFQEV